MADACPTGKAERLLLAADGSEFSEGAVREAIRLAKRCSGSLSAVSVIETNPEFEATAPAVLEKLEQEKRAYLESLSARAKKEGVDCGYAVYEGEDSYKNIVDEAVKQKATMIVMGRRGKKGFRRLVMGSTTAWVIGHAPCSVLVVPRAAEVGYKSIVVGTDGSRYAEASVREAIALAKRNGGRLTVVAVVPAELATPADIDFVMSQKELIAEKEMHDAEKNARAAKDAAKQAGVDAKAYVMSGRPAEAILEAAKDAQADLIVLGSHGRTGIDRLLMGSVAERVIVQAACAVQVVKAG